MKITKLLGERFRETPSDCQIESHALMMRGGYMKYVANGIFSLFMPTKRITRKIEQIIREEMDAVDGQEVLFPVVMPASLWEESGRYTGIGSEMARWRDRNGNPMVLGMTHEEAAVQLARDTARSYTSYPFMIYQIQTKFRDEPRARGGLIRVREFTMKDAYSFHTSREDMEQYYDRVHKAYERIFARCGADPVVSVQSDSGMMGGSVSHEFMLLSEVGEDTLAICEHCSYKSNMEAAAVVVQNEAGEVEPLTLLETPNVKTIEGLQRKYGLDPKRMCKAVFFQRNADDHLIVVFVRADLDVNETKLRNHLGYEIHPATNLPADCGVVPGFTGPVSLAPGSTVLYDKSLDGIASMACGANQPDRHYLGMNLARDVGEVSFVDVAKIYAGAICPVCGKPTITIEKGIEVGNIFQLGTKYTKSMNMTYTDQNGEAQTPIMACYGIGVGRLAASVCQNSRDKFGPIWPMSIAPWQVHVCALRVDDAAVKETADKLYADLQAAGVEVLYDDRNISAGSMFSDADLLGIPVRVVVSPKTLERAAIEISYRDKSVREDAPIADAVSAVKAHVEKLLAQYR